MDSSEVLQELAREVRQGTLQILAAAQTAWLTWTPSHTSNHILWHAGHALWLQDVMCVQPLSGQSELPARWSERFGMNSYPASTSVWPDRADVEQLLEAQLQRMLKLLGEVSPSQHSQPAPNLGGRRNLAGWIVHGLHDEAKHSGETCCGRCAACSRNEQERRDSRGTSHVPALQSRLFCRLPRL